ncbi:MAG: hypothetical protein AAF353_00065 [Pseudomonadota bacterium]
METESFVRRTSVQGLGIQNRSDGNNTIVVGIYCSQCNTKISNVGADVFGRSGNIGFDVAGPGGIQLKDVNVLAIGGISSTGIEIFSTVSSLNDVAADVEDGSSINMGVQVINGSITTRNLSAAATVEAMVLEFSFGALHLIWSMSTLM